MIDPDRDLRRASAEVEISGNVDARRRLAEELFERGQYEEAIEMYQGGLKGIFEYDPTLLLGLARAQFAKQDFAAARATLERLDAAQSGLQVGRRAASVRPTPRRRRMHWRRRSASTQRSRRAIRARRRAYAMVCC